MEISTLLRYLCIFPLMGVCAYATLMPSGAFAMAGEHKQAGSEVKNLTAESNFELAKNLAMIRGHLEIGSQLVKAGMWEAARPHFMHPLNEVYPSIENTLHSYKLPPFDGTVGAISEHVRNENIGRYRDNLDLLESQLHRAEQATIDREQQKEKFTLKVAGALLREAAFEYQEGFGNKDNSPKEAEIEYQDARGFVYHFEKKIESQEDFIIKTDEKRLSKIRKEMAYLKRAFPTLTMPKRWISTPEDFNESLKRIEIEIEALVK